MTDAGFPDISVMTRVTLTNIIIPDNAYASVGGRYFEVGNGFLFDLGEGSMFEVLT